jgi:hypothetical protein
MTEASNTAAASSADTSGDPIAATVAPGYAFSGPVLELGGLMLDAQRLAGIVRGLFKTGRH